VKEKVVVNCDHLKKLKFSSSLPYAFTEHGAVMLASVLNSGVAVEVSIQVVRTFNRLREYIAHHKALAQKLEVLEKKYKAQFKIVFDAIRQLMSPPAEPLRRERRIGYQGINKKTPPNWERRPGDTISEDVDDEEIHSG